MRVRRVRQSYEADEVFQILLVLLQAEQREARVRRRDPDHLFNKFSLSQSDQSIPQKALKFNSLPPTVATISPFPDTLYFTQQLT